MSAPHRRVLAVCAGATVLSCCLALAFVGAFHKLTPHRVPVALVTPAPAAASQLRAELTAHAPDALALRTYPDSNAALRAVRARDTDGALIVSQGSLQVLVAGAGGSATKQFISAVGQTIATGAKLKLELADVVPLPAHDSNGLSIFFTLLAVLIPSLALGVASAALGRGTRPLLHAGFVLGGAVAIGCAVALISDPVFGALQGHFWALWGLATLDSLAIALPTTALTLIKLPLAAVAVLLFLAIGIPASGGPAGMQSFVPGLFRWSGGWLPPGRAVNALTNTIYFGAHHVAGSIWVLLIWAAAGLTLIAIHEHRWSTDPASVRETSTIGRTPSQDHPGATDNTQTDDS